MPSQIKLSGEQIESLVDFADGEECKIKGSFSGISNGTHERIRWVEVTRSDDKEKVIIYETGQIQRVPDGT